MCSSPTTPSVALALLAQRVTGLLDVLERGLGTGRRIVVAGRSRQIPDLRDPHVELPRATHRSDVRSCPSSTMVKVCSCRWSLLPVRFGYQRQLELRVRRRVDAVVGEVAACPGSLGDAGRTGHPWRRRSSCGPAGSASGRRRRRSSRRRGSAARSLAARR